MYGYNSLERKGHGSYLGTFGSEVGPNIGRIRPN